MQLADGEDVLQLVRTAPIGICILNAGSLVCEILNDAFLEIAGKSYEQICGRSYWDAFAGLRPLFENDVARAAKGETIRSEETVIQLVRHGRQEMIVISFIYAPVKNKAGNVTNVAVWVIEETNRVNQRRRVQVLNEELAAANEQLASSNEELSAINEELQLTQYSLNELNKDLEKRVTERTREYADLNRDLQASELRTQSIVQNAPFPIGVYIGRELRISLANKSIIDVWGKGSDVIGKLYSDILPELENQAVFSQLDAVYTTGKPFHARNQQIDLMVDDRLRTYYFNYSFTALTGQDGKIYGVMNTAADVTDAVLAKQELERASHDLSALNEELAASVEEQQASNEEMAAVNEEIVATNDELAAVNGQLLHAQLALEESEDQLRFTLNAIPSQVWTATPEGALNYVNEVVCKDFGYNTEEIVGHGWQEFILPGDLGNCLEKWTTALQTGNDYSVDFRLKFSDGNYYWHLARAVPYLEDGKIKMWLGTNTNIDLQKQNEQKKDEFLSIASHELKTPLTSIKLYNQLINRTNNENQIKTFAGKTTDHILRLERLINDLLDVTKINAGKMNYAFEAFNFGDMISDSVEVIRAIAPHEIVIEDNVHIPYMGDRFRLEQVMNNFLSNAIKYSPGFPRIIVKAALEHESIIVSVQDFGIGIDRESIDRLFDRYYRVDNTAMRFDGLGLGLFISSEILKRHNGSFWIESEKGKGSTFYYRLPLQKKHDGSPPVVTATTYRHETLTIDYLEDARRIEVDWKGFQDMTSVQAGCMAMLDVVVKNKCDRVVNDNTHVLGNWSEAAEWVGNVWFPMMEKAGLKYFAHIFSPSTFSQLAAQKSIDIMAGIITTQYFTDIDLARNWIDNCG